MINKLRQWRKERNITESNTMVYVENVIEELLEIFNKDKSTIDIKKEEIMLLYFKGYEPLSTKVTLDAIDDISVFSINETELMGYDKNKTMDETFKEIDSREQCPMQKEVWDNWKPSGKWKKDKNQDEDTLYVADYDGCKLDD